MTSDGFYRRRNDHERQPLLSSKAGISSVVMVIVALIIGFVLGYDQTVTSKAAKALAEPKTMTALQMSTSQFTTPLSIMELLGVVSMAKHSLTRTLTADYGEYMNVLIDKAELSRLFLLSDESKGRYIRRIIQKVISKHNHPEAPSTFIWITAGDAAAAGLGNKVDESYTAVLEATVRSAFSAVGVDFTAKNHGMSGYGSAPELALCMESMYGSDIDILSWDFGPVDGDQYYRSALWGTRAAVHPTKPLLFMIDAKNSERWGEMSKLNGRGMGVGLMDTAAFAQIKLRFPDSRLVSNPKDLPSALQYFMCNGATEGSFGCDDPSQQYACDVDEGDLCRAHKFKPQGTCEQERFRASWIPGWKDHHLKGRLLGLFLLNLLLDALIELEKVLDNPGFPQAPSRMLWGQLLDKLAEQDGLDNFLFENSLAPDSVLGRYAEIMSSLDPHQTLFQKPTECQLGGQTIYSQLHESTNAKQGLKGMLPQKFSFGSALQPDKERGDCNVVEFGHREGHMLKQEASWWNVAVPIPTSADGSAGLIAACFQTCLDEDCSGSHLDGLDGIKVANKNIEIEVDMIAVTGTLEMDSCHFLVGIHGLHWRSSGEPYSVRFRVNEERGSMLVTSVIAI